MEKRTNNYCINKAKKQLREATALVCEAANVLGKIDKRYLPKTVEHTAEALMLYVIGMSNREELYLEELEKYGAVQSGGV